MPHSVRKKQETRGVSGAQLIGMIAASMAAAMGLIVVMVMTDGFSDFAALL